MLLNTSMGSFDQTKVRLDNGSIAEAASPEILSVSRRTDIPAFYSDWFFNRLSKGRNGYIDTVNPFNQNLQHISFRNTKFIVFWSKNPKPMVKYLDMLDGLGIDWHLQFTLNAYPMMFEPNLPPLEERIQTFKEISDKYGADRVIWRYDPIFYVSQSLGVDVHLIKIASILDAIEGLTNKLVISFADIDRYRKVIVNLRGTGATELSIPEQKQFAEKLRLLIDNKALSHLKIATCSEDVDLSAYGIGHNACIDAELISKLSRDKGFSERTAVAGKDPGQRGSCLCTKARDIGVYDTCAHGCKYCYANITPDSAKVNFEKLKKKMNKSCLI